jgi:hypothetical protein
MDRHPTPIFLFAPARSGSTLVQRILAANNEIATASEPHILLPLLYALKTGGEHQEHDIYGVYNHELLVRAVQDFCLSLPNGEADYLNQVRDFTLNLYQKAAQGSPKFFLDKTPQYHLIAKEILEIFPEARVIFLWRNPLAITASFLAYGNGLWNLYWWERHLFRGMRDLIKCSQDYAGRIHTIHYENLINNPEATGKDLFGFLGLDFNESYLQDFSKVDIPGKVGDPNRFLEGYQQLRTDKLEQWKQILTNPLRKAWCRKYLRWLGREQLEWMGYSIDQLLEELNSLPLSFKYLGSDLLRMPYGYFYRLFEFRIIRKKLAALRAGERVYVHTGFYQ